MTTPTGKPADNAARELLDRLDHLDDSLPPEASEDEALLAEAGIDASEELKRSMLLVARAKAEAVAARFDQARRERTAAESKLTRPERPKRTRAENLSLIECIAAALPAGREMVVQHRGFESAPDDDVDSLAAEMELLAEHHVIPKK